MEETLVQRLRRGGLLFDGAAGTTLMQVGSLPPERLGLAALEHPDLLAEVHRAFLAAGSEVLLTATFSASRAALEAAGAAERPPEAVREATRIAREAADAHGAPSWVLGDLGPLGLWARGADDAALRSAYREEALLLLEGGVDGLLVETLPGMSEASLALEALREVTALPICISLTYHSRVEGAFETLDGEPLPGVLRALAAAGADAVGLNCGEGSRPLLEVLGSCVEASPVPLVARPSTGVPGPDGGADSGPQEFARDLVEAGRLGAAGLGGCCGAGPPFIAALREQLGAR